MQALFEVGQVVALKADPARNGPVIAVLPAVGGRPRYRVFHSGTDIREYDENQLLLVHRPPVSDALVQAVSAGEWLDVGVFRARLTASRLSHPLIDSLYALHAARIKYVPFQFKPLLRFLRADQPRLLIADEVGVGKTIEAGLILRELQTRQQVDNILIVCPKALVPKWRMEMRRFDEDFRPLTPEALRYCLREAYLDGAWPVQYSRAVAPLELLRREDYLVGTCGRRARPGLLTLSPPPVFSIVVVDEAHHMRNPETGSYDLAHFLCDVSEAVLFLSATPVHLSSRNLYTLLNLLRPDMFPDEDVFHQVVEPNRHLNKAMRHVRAQAPAGTWQTDASYALQDAKATSWGRQALTADPRFSEWSKRMAQGEPLSDSDRIRCLRDLEEVHSLAHVMNRTRRRDIGRFTVREPHTVSVPFTPEQQAFYERLVAFRREILLLEHDPRVVRLVIDTVERQASSCLPGLVPLLDGFLRTGRFGAWALTDEPEMEDERVDLPPAILDKAKELRELAAKLPADDPKLDRLRTITRQTLEARGPGKVLVFSFFLHTLGYLEAHLRTDGYRLGLVTGRVDDDERETLRARFRLPKSDENALDILLSSEVGSEGLDYEFCDRLVNYDIPWNPMRIEQRIGRIDRFGQTSEKVLIFNFVTPGTVEERIFFRCFERLGIFRDTVGELEEVLGDVVQDLTRTVLNPVLTPEQAEEKAQQAADNALRFAEEQRRLEAEGSGLLGLDQPLLDEIDDLARTGRSVSPDALRQMIEAFLEQPELGGGLSPMAGRERLHRVRLRKEARAMLLEEVRSLGKFDRPTVEFMRWLEGDAPYLIVTFDQEMALERREIPFVTPIHPLARVATVWWGERTEPLVAQVRASDDDLPPGCYLFVCELWETIALRPTIQLVGLAWDVRKRSLAGAVSSALLPLLTQGEQPDTTIRVQGPVLQEGLQQLNEAAHARRLQALVQVRETNESLVDRKLASLDAYRRNRLQRVEAEIEKATDPRILRMKESERARIERDYQIKRKQVLSRREADIVRQRISAGVLALGEPTRDAERLQTDFG